MKKTALIFISVLVFMTAFVISANAETVTGSCGNNVTYTLTDEGVLTISGTGPMTDYISEYLIPWRAKRASIKSVKIESGVTHIGEYSFYDCAYVTAIEIPESVESIGMRAFQNCTSLAEIQLPGQLTSLSNGLFYGCTSLKSIILPDSVKTMEAQMFEGCSALEYVKLPAKLIGVVGGTFKNCVSLKNVVIPHGAGYIYSSAFAGCTALESVTIPSTVYTIQDNNGAIFDGCPSTLIVYGVKGSKAETYANSKSITFKELPILSHSIFAQHKFTAANMTAVKIRVDNASETTATGLQVTYNSVTKNLENTVVEGKGIALIGVFVPGTVDVTADDFKISAINY